MRLNMGTLDRRVRLFVLAPLLVVGGVSAGPSGAPAVVLYFLALVMAATSLVGSCPIYTLLGVESSAKRPSPSDKPEG